MMTNRIFEALESFEVVGVALLLSLSILSCGGDAAGPANRDAPTPVATTLTPSATVLSFSSLGATEQLTVTVHDQNGAAMSGASVAWASSASSVASVTPTGLITAVADGTATVTATSGSAAGTVSVTVATLEITTSSPMPDGVVGTLYSETLAATGGDGNYTWAMFNSTTLPANLGLHTATGEISGIPSTAAATNFEVEVTSAGQTATKALAITIGPPAPSVTTGPAMPNGAVGALYSETLAAAGGDGNYTWAMFNSTTLPAGLVLNTATGEISGTPSAEATTNFEVEVTSAGQTGTKALWITIGQPAPSVTTSSPMPDGVVGRLYSETLAATGGDGNYTWAMFNSTTLPAGLGLNTATGEINGIPSTAATTNFEVEVTSAGQTGTKALAITIGEPVVASVEVSPTQVTFRALGTTQQFTAVAKDASGVEVHGKSFSWSSSEVSVATIDATGGLATAVEDGTTEITATTDGVSGSTALEVEQMATKVVLVTQPTDAVSGELISPAVVAEIRDANDHLAPFAFASVTLAIETNPRGGTLSGAPPVNTTAGVATFNGLSIDKPATDYTLTASSGTLASATSEPFSITQRMCSLVPIPRPLPGAFSSEVGVADYYAIDEIRVSDLDHVELVFGGWVIADFNNDGLDDVITSGPRGVEGTPIRIVANDGTGSFVDATSTIIEGAVPAPVHARQALAADFNGDGWTDVFFANHGYDMSPGPGELNTLLLSNGAGKLVDSPGNIHNVVGFTHSAAAGDVDCDGDIDIYVGTIGSPATNVPNYLLINDGAGNFEVRPDYLPELVLFFNDGLHPDWNSAAIVDLDGDNLAELVLGGGDGPPYDRITETIILWNDGTGNFDYAEFTQLPAVPGFGGSVDALAIDIDGDGDLDLLFPIQAGTERRIQIMVNNGDRTFTDETDLRLFGMSGDGQWIERIQPIDFNSDGAPDLLITHSDYQSEGYPELIFLNNGVGVFTALDNSVIADKTGKFFPLDADGDGGLDFIVRTFELPWGFSLLVQLRTYP